MRRLKRFLPCVALTLLAVIVGEPCRAQDSADVAKIIVPFVKKHCVECHGAEKPKAGLSLHAFQDSTAILKARKVWDAALQQIEAGEMPPARQPQPTAEEKTAFVKSVRAIYMPRPTRAGPIRGQV